MKSLPKICILYYFSKCLWHLFKSGLEKQSKPWVSWTKFAAPSKTRAWFVPSSVCTNKRCSWKPLWSWCHLRSIILFLEGKSLNKQTLKCHKAAGQEDGVAVCKTSQLPAVTTREGAETALSLEVLTPGPLTAILLGLKLPLKNKHSHHRQKQGFIRLSLFTDSIPVRNHLPNSKLWKIEFREFHVP